MNKPMCPYCGSQMENVAKVRFDERKNEWWTGWCFCTSCGAECPKVHGRLTMERAIIDARERAMQMYKPPAKPLTLDEVIEKSKNVSDNVIWLEQPDEEYGYDDTECIPALLSNFSRVGASGIQYVKFLVWPKNEIVFPVIDKLEYGETWRCWSRRPTDAERKAAKWNE